MSPDEPGPAGNRQLDFLLADFGALKAEIARRSGLQRVALALYLALVAAVAASLPAGKNLSLSTAGLWMGGLIALLFWCREHLEITRLGRLIVERIGEMAGTILNVPKEHIVPSEAAATIDKGMDSTHAAFAKMPKGTDLREACFGAIDLEVILDQIRR